MHIQKKIKYHKLFPEEYLLCANRDFIFFTTKQKIPPHLKATIYSLNQNTFFFNMQSNVHSISIK